jgi:hypothetical protein
MEPNSLLNAGLFLSVLTYVGYQLKSIPLTLWNFIKRKITYSLTIEETDELYVYMERWLSHNYKDNRKGETFHCLNCGYENDADVNASINIHNRGIYSSFSQ